MGETRLHKGAGLLRRMGMTKERKSYPGDVSDEEWGFCAPYLTLMKGDAPLREHPLRELYNGLRWFVRAGCPWRMMPNDLPPWQMVQQQTQRWLRARIVSSTWRMTGACCLRRTAGGNVELAYVDQGYTGEKPAAAGGGQTPQGQARLCPASQTLGGGTHVRVGGALPAAGPRLRTARLHALRLPLAGLLLPHAQFFSSQKSMTGS